MKSILFSMLFLSSAAFADTLVISHPQNDEIMQGDFVSVLGNDISFSVNDYDSNAWDRINSSNFDDVTQEWHIRLNLFGDEIVDFTYHCRATFHVGSAILYCVD